MNQRDHEPTQGQAALSDGPFRRKESRRESRKQRKVKPTTERAPEALTAAW